MKKLFILLLLFSNVAYGQCFKPDLVDGAIADVVTTTAVIVTNVGKEANPIGLVGTLATKGILLYSSTKVDEETKKEIDDWAGSLWSGAAINNLLILFGASNPISISAGILSFIYFKTLDCSDK